MKEYEDHYEMVGKLAPDHMEIWDRLSKKWGNSREKSDFARRSEKIEKPSPPPKLLTKIESDAYQYGWDAAARQGWGVAMGGGPGARRPRHFSPEEARAFDRGWYDWLITPPLNNSPTEHSN